MRLEITSLSLRGEDGIAVTFDISSDGHGQRQTFLLDAKTVADLGLKVGECGRELFDEVEYVSKVCAAKRTLLSSSIIPSIILLSPMKSATKAFLGSLYISVGVPIC